jgi:predicted DCC family thiol-disulfide oxidoreductase YuxK
MKNIVLFDGICNFCNSTVLVIIKYDKNNNLKFASQQSEYGRLLLANYNIIENNLNTIYFIRNDKAIFSETEALFEIIKLLNWKLRILLLFRILPLPFSNFIYRFFSKNRYKWFGKMEKCSIPTDEIKTKFLDY